MIRNEREYQYTLDRIQEFEEQLEAMKARLSVEGFEESAVSSALAGTTSILDDLRFERDYYERLRKEGASAVFDYPPEERGKALIALRIAVGRTQRELADTLGINEAQVSRDERNDYHGITQERYARVLKALGVEEHVAGYVERNPIIVHLPVIDRCAASFAPDPEHRLVVKMEGI